jgi:hypothetical protein
MGCLFCKPSFKYIELDSNCKIKKLSSNSKYIFFLECNTTTSYKYYYFTIYNKNLKKRDCKVLLTLNMKPKWLLYEYDNVNDILDISFTVKCYLYDSYIYKDIDYKIKVMPQTCKYKMLSYKNDCDIRFYSDINYYNF